jgi:uncharacterized protein (TIGR03437 family)
MLIITGGPLDGSSFNLDGPPKEKLLGSSAECNLRLELGNVEPIHARIQPGSEGFLLTDAQSGTGTYVNGEKIGARYKLQDGDRICLGPPGSKGSAKLLVRVPDGYSPGDAGGSGEMDLFAPGPTSIEMDSDEPLVLIPVTPSAQSSGLEPAPSRPASPPPPPPPLSAEPPPPPPIAHEEAPEIEIPRAAPPPSPPPPAAPATAARKPAKADYAVDPPSIADDRLREALVPPPAARPAAARKAPARAPVKQRSAKRSSLPIVPIAGVLVVALLGAGGYYAFTTMKKASPVVSGVTPPKAAPGQTITIAGTDLGTSPGETKVRFGEIEGKVTSVSPTSVSAVIPASVPVQPQVQVSVESRGVRSNAMSIAVALVPRLKAIEPDVAMPGQEVVLTGENLDGKPLTVLVAAVPAEVKEATATAVRIRVPELPVAEGKGLPITVQIGSESASGVNLVFGKLPLVTALEPSSGAFGDRVTIKGRGFDADLKANRVTFGGQAALVISGSPTELAVAVPGVPSPESQAEVVVDVKGSTSTPTNFAVVRLSSASYRPRFYPAPVAERPDRDHVFVSTELGPVLLLSGKADAASTAERAFKVAASLNKLFDQAANAPVTLEVREAPAPAVGVAGATELLVTATPEDAAGYELPWDPSVKGRRASPRGVATYWTALLQDYLSLFAMRQRPVRLLDVSARAKPLLEIYAEAVRGSGSSGGVPPRVVSPLSTSLAKGLRDIALLLPAESGSRAGARLEGRWDGTMEEGAGAKPIRVRLRLEGSKLAGSMTSSAGKIAVDLPLKDVVFDKGALRFTLTSSGTTRFFNGPLAGEAIDGTIHASAGGPAVGRFSLRYVVE